MSTRDVAVAWVRSPSDDISNHNHQFYSHGGALYSYGAHFPVARLIRITNDAGSRRAMVVNSERYSVTTSKHQGYARMAAAHDGLEVYEAPGADPALIEVPLGLRVEIITD